jgi:ABC-type protease/lipase transport system fused ATPase/permease subunit
VSRRRITLSLMKLEQKIARTPMDADIGVVGAELTPGQSQRALGDAECFRVLPSLVELDNPPVQLRGTNATGLLGSNLE